ncbi:MAG TPA: hypothetical protein VHB25_01440 [Gemmatimonadaceae bacterium]|nr:hypothetical protein [Gemmatimonadaceae bacterium]
MFERSIAATLLATAAAMLPLRLQAQGVVISGASSAQYVELRPLVLDSVLYDSTTAGWSYYRLTPTGIPSTCQGTNAYCTFFRSSNQQSLTAMMQDLDVTAWGLGQGISAHAELRARTATGTASDLWPQATQHFDALAAYVDIDRAFGRARLGRQWIRSTLGVFNFDGGMVSLHPLSWLSGEVYGGGALVEGLNRPLSADELTPVEDVPPADHAYLVGTQLEFRPSSTGAITAQYQRELRRDRNGLYSERFAATGEFRVGITTLSGVLSRDLATSVNNEMSATLRVPILRTLDGTFTLRHYAPYFDLWTIWGAFSPVGYDEFTSHMRWASPEGRVTLGGDAGWRNYDDTQTGVASLPLRTNGWRLGGTGSVRVTNALSLAGDYNRDIGPGASSSSGDLSLQWITSDALHFALNSTAFQNVGEYAIGDGTVYGMGGETGIRLTPEVQLVGDVFFYRHLSHDKPNTVNWNQRRASLRLEWTLGSQPTWGGAIGKARGSAGSVP